MTEQESKEKIVKTIKENGVYNKGACGGGRR